MKDSKGITGRSQIAYEILSYLVENPDAQDTLEGIIEWWLLEQQIKQETAKVKEVVEELIVRGLLLEDKDSNSRTRYRINRSRLGEIQSLLKERPN